jgi:cephalosporin hydroxylase
MKGVEDRGGTWSDTYWMGVPTLKCPLDMWIYQEIIFEREPDWIIEAGTKHGGSAYFLASICDLIQTGRIITIDIEELDDRPGHERISYWTGSSTSNKILDRLEEKIEEDDSVMVILDSDHSKKHVLDELTCYSKLVTDGDYLIVEDTNLNGNPVWADFGPGPKEAVEEFLDSTNQFQVDERREKFLLTFNPGGYLRKN